MVLIKILVEIVLTKLQRFESRATVKKTLPRRTGPDLQNVRETVHGFGKISHGSRVKFNADFEYEVSFDHTGF